MLRVEMLESREVPAVDLIGFTAGQWWNGHATGTTQDDLQSTVHANISGAVNWALAGTATSTVMA